MKRTPLNGRRAPLKRRKGLDTTGGGLRRRSSPPKVAGHRRPELNVPAATRDQLRTRSGGHCEAYLPVDGCTEDATDVHHRQRRRDGGHAIANLLDLCRTCHAWAHAHPEAARVAGVIVSVYEDPTAVPVDVHSRLTGQVRRVLLTADGGYLS